MGDPEDLDWLLEGHGFLSWLDMSIIEMTHGRVVFHIPFDEKLTNPTERSNASIHGGIAATLMDTAGGVALRTTHDTFDEAVLATTDLNISYLRPAFGDLVAEAEVVRVGNTIGVSRVDVTSTTPDGEEKPVTTGRASYRLFGDWG